MKFFRIQPGDKILLVGEGNFSFSVDFLNLNQEVIERNKNFDFHRSIDIISSCFESYNTIFNHKKENVYFLEQKGCTVLQNVDATRLKEHPVIGCRQFTKIIFNFPHVGGKMKIHLNRKLLADFFSSAKNVLDKDGMVIVTLCSGQGGTGADKNQRDWNNTWKVVEMAAESNFALKNVCPFMLDYFPGYSSVGYKSLEKEFNTNDAFVHVFKLGEPYVLINFSVAEIESLFELQTVNSLFGTLNVSKIHAQKILQDPFNSKNSLQKYLYELIKNSLMVEYIKFFEEDLIYGLSCQYTSADECMDKYFLNVRADRGYSITVFKGLLLKDLTGNFESQPVSCEVVFVGRGSSTLAEKAIYKLAQNFKSFKLSIVSMKNNSDCNVFYVDDNTKTVLFKVKLCSDNIKSIEICTIFLDNIAKFLFCLDSWHELWALGNRIDYDNGIKLFTPCLYPCAYTFDLSFSVHGYYSEEKFFNILWHLAGNIVFSVNLISTYEPVNKNVKHFCYRINYKSYEVPLYRKLVIDFQRNIIGRTLEIMLNAVIL